MLGDVGSGLTTGRHHFWGAQQAQEICINEGDVRQARFDRRDWLSLRSAGF